VNPEESNLHTSAYTGEELQDWLNWLATQKSQIPR
jgi:hypothetical protein